MANYTSDIYKCYRFDKIAEGSKACGPQNITDSNQLLLLSTFSVLRLYTTSQTSDGRLNDTTTHSHRKHFVVFPRGQHIFSK